MSLTPTDTPVFVPEDKAGRILGGEEKPISVRTLQRMREDGRGPPYHKFGQAVRYELSDLLSYAAAHRRDSTSQAAATSASIETSAAPTITPASQQPPKRRRGRPLGSKNRPKPSASLEATAT